MYMLRGVETMADVTRQRIEAVLALMASASTAAEKVLPKVHVPAILDVVFRHPYCKLVPSTFGCLWVQDFCVNNPFGSTTISSMMLFLKP